MKTNRNLTILLKDINLKTQIIKVMNKNIKTLNIIFDQFKAIKLDHLKPIRRMMKILKIIKEIRVIINYQKEIKSKKKHLI